MTAARIVVTHAKADGSRPERSASTKTRCTAQACATKTSSRPSTSCLTKPGYGIVSECIANDTRLLYTSRGRFREYEVFIEEMPRALPCQFIPRDDLAAGRWQDATAKLLAQPAVTPPPTNGATVAAERLLALL